MVNDLIRSGDWVLIVLVMAGAVPELAAAWQFLLVVGHFWRNHYSACEPIFPRTAILIPAWNEAAVIGASIDRLMALEYPRDRLRIFLVDDASTDETPQIAKAKEAQYPGNVVHLRRDKGGEGKAHTLNHGLGIILRDDWMEALLVTDADVIFVPDSLRKMTRHLADPRVGAVTAYIKEGSRPGNYLTRFIGYEYITAQAAARRGQNVLGAIACLAGGAQLHSRANLVALGSRIDTSSLAEDTFTTFETQLRGRRVVFEPHATCWAEEPDSIGGLWKQRLRWARGNVQVTLRYRKLWFRPRRGRLGGITFGILWFCLFLQPLFMITSSASLLALYFSDVPQRLDDVSPAVDRQRRHLHLHHRLRAAHRPANRAAHLAAGPDVPRRDEHGHHRLYVLPPAVPRLLRKLFAVMPLPLQAHKGWIVVFIYAWLSTSMAVAYLAKTAEPHRFGRFISAVLVYIAGYGSLLCACTFTSYVKELRGAEMKWDKTEKTGKVAIPT